MASGIKKRFMDLKKEEPCKKLKNIEKDLHKSPRMRLSDYENNKENINDSNCQTNFADEWSGGELEDEKLATLFSASQKCMIDVIPKTEGSYENATKLEFMKNNITNIDEEAYQRIAWEALKKSIHRHINRINSSNISSITRELLKENIVRGRGLLTHSILQAQADAPILTSVYAILVAMINCHFPNIGNLLLTRLVNQFKRACMLHDDHLCTSSGSFIVHLINQNVADENIIWDLLNLLLKKPTNYSVRISIAILKECEIQLVKTSKIRLEEIFVILRNILYGGNTEENIPDFCEAIFQISKNEVRDQQGVPSNFNFVGGKNQIMHTLKLNEVMDSQDILDIFKFDPEFMKNENEYAQHRRQILDLNTRSGNGNYDELGKKDTDNEGEKTDGIILDYTQTNLTDLRINICLTIQSSSDFEKCARTLMKFVLEQKPGQEDEFFNTFLDCCAELQRYDKFYGLLASYFCGINRMYKTRFEMIFKKSIDTIHRVDMKKIRNIASFFAHLLTMESISWNILGCIKLNENDTTIYNSIFFKLLFRELIENMGRTKFNSRIKDVNLREVFEGFFPSEDPRSKKFARDFFTSIEMGGISKVLEKKRKRKSTFTRRKKSLKQ